MRSRHFALAAALLIAPPTALSGCGGGDTVRVTGKLLKGGVKYDPPSGQVVNVTLVGIGEAGVDSGGAAPGGEPFPAEVDQAAGTFSVPGADRRGIPPGKYRVAVTQKMTREALSAASPKARKGVNRETDVLGGRYGLATSPIVREVKTGGELVVDLDRPAG